jgi:hypothetical protein
MDPGATLQSGTYSNQSTARINNRGSTEHKHN